jgi:hypothetical protein
LVLKVSDNHRDHKPTISLSVGERQNLLGRVESAPPLLLIPEVSPEAGSSKFRWELFALGYGRDNLSFGCTTLNEAFLRVRMESHFHFIQA